MALGTLYIHPRSPRSNWLPLVINHLNLDIEVKIFNETPEFKANFPLGKAPAYLEEENNFKLTEFVAIAEYFLSISDNKTYIGENLKDKMQVLRWLSYANQDLADIAGQFFFVAKTDDEKANLSAKMKDQLKFVENELSTRSFLATNYITFADVYFFTSYKFYGAIVGGFTTDSYPNLTKWFETMKENDPIAKDILANM